MQGCRRRSHPPCRVVRTGAITSPSPCTGVPLDSHECVVLHGDRGTVGESKIKIRAINGPMLASGDPSPSPLPVRLLLLRPSSVNALSLPSSGGITPDKGSETRHGRHMKPSTCQAAVLLVDLAGVHRIPELLSVVQEHAKASVGVISPKQ